jgi:hypothetical protein
MNPDSKNTSEAPIASITEPEWRATDILIAQVITPPEMRFHNLLPIFLEWRWLLNPISTV